MPRSPSGLRHTPSKRTYIGSNPIRGTIFIENYKKLLYNIYKVKSKYAPLAHQAEH